MRFGVNIVNFGPGATPSSLRGSVQAAEDMGFHLAMISDHVAVTPDVQARYPAPFYDPFTTLAWLAGATDRIELGTTVTILPYRNPLLTARIAANIDRFTDGRLVLGVGVGWARQEYEALGVPFGRRGPMTDEYLAAIKTLWTNDVASMTGEFVAFRDVHTEPRPARSPHPPIWVGGTSKAAIRRAARYGDVWHPLRARIGWMRDEGLPALRRTAEDMGRVTPDFCPRISLRITDTRLDDERRLPGEGTLDQIHRDLDALAALGARYVVLDAYDPDRPSQFEDRRRALETLAERVLDLKAEALR